MARTKPKTPPTDPVEIIARVFELLPCEVELALRQPYTKRTHEAEWPHHNPRKIR